MWGPQSMCRKEAGQMVEYYVNAGDKTPSAAAFEAVGLLGGRAGWDAS